mmetsp:Transcript_41422/g.110516  ORF Transcript_41422/g.110516 Transcript_41422/m.110516 type:complete len:238 (+) Transcript_41422:1105-1818(+)
MAQVVRVCRGRRGSEPRAAAALRLGVQVEARRVRVRRRGEVRAQVQRGTPVPRDLDRPRRDALAVTNAAAAPVRRLERVTERPVEVWVGGARAVRRAAATGGQSTAGRVLLQQVSKPAHPRRALRRGRHRRHPAMARVRARAALCCRPANLRYLLADIVFDDLVLVEDRGLRVLQLRRRVAPVERADLEVPVRGRDRRHLVCRHDGTRVRELEHGGVTVGGAAPHQLPWLAHGPLRE